MDFQSRWNIHYLWLSNLKTGIQTEINAKFKNNKNTHPSINNNNPQIVASYAVININIIIIVIIYFKTWISSSLFCLLLHSFNKYLLITNVCKAFVPARGPQTEQFLLSEGYFPLRRMYNKQVKNKEYYFRTISKL